LSYTGCGGIFSVTSNVGNVKSSNSTNVTVPPQVMIQMLVGEAGAQAGSSDLSQPSIAVSARNRFGDSNFPGGTAGTYQTVMVPGQYAGLSLPAAVQATSGVNPELQNAADVFSGTTGPIIPTGAKCYWSPTSAQWAIIKTALQTGATKEPANIGTPDCWSPPSHLPSGKSRQIVYKTSVGMNQSGGKYAGAPAFVFLQLSSTGSPAR
jgi:hypothetical protein